MDIISLSKASKALRNIQEIDQQIVAPGAESHFVNVDARIDWIESQASNLNLTRVQALLTEDATFKNTELVDGVLQLKHSVINHEAYSKDYKKTGTYEKTFDLTGSFVNTISGALIKNATAKESAKVEIATSTDNVTYTPFSEWNAAALPNTRYLKVRITLTSNSETSITYKEPVSLIPNPSIVESKLIAKESNDMKIDSSWTDEGSLHRKLISKDDWLRIDKLNVVEKVN